MDNTIYGLLGSGGEGLGLDALGLLGNGQPPSAFGNPNQMPGGGTQGGVTPIPNAQPGQGGAMMAPATHPMPQAAPPMTSAPQPQQLAGILQNAGALMQAGAPHTMPMNAPSMLGGGMMPTAAQPQSPIGGNPLNALAMMMGKGTPFPATPAAQAQSGAAATPSLMDTLKNLFGRGGGNGTA
ncbi:MAG: hypothetical protein QJR04_25200 [Burkholderia multivorans]|nr:hypothetical protein [Burkholderia multivorans]